MPLPAVRTLRPAVAAALTAALAMGAATAQAGPRQGAGTPAGKAAAAHAKTKRAKAKRPDKHRTKRAQRRRTRSVAVRTGGSGWVPPALLGPRRTFGAAAGAGSGAPAPTTFPGGGAPGATPAAPGDGTTTAAPTPTRRTALGIRAQEFSFTFNGSGLTAGPLLVQLQNYGEDPHDLVIVRDGGSVVTKLPVTPARAGDAAPPGLTEATVDLSAGRYTLYCTLADHASRGMQASLTVAP